LAGYIAKCGLLKAGGSLGVKQLYKRYRRLDDKTIWTLLDEQASGVAQDHTPEERCLLKYLMAVRIKFVGIWDSVGELGIY
jgi:uncharacterized protein (DUF2235 family)